MLSDDFYTAPLLRKLSIKVCCILLCVILMLCGCSSASKENRTIAEINGIPVSVGELEMFIPQAKQLSESYFKSKHNLDNIEGEDWYKEYDGVSPAMYAAEAAARELAPYKLTQQRLLELGDLTDISYSSFIEKWENENALRKQKSQAGEILYGPVTYTKLVYYNYLQIENKEKLKELTVIPSPDEIQLRKIYEEDPDLFYTFGSAEMQYAAIPQDMFTNADVQTLYEAMKTDLSSGYSFVDAADKNGILAYTAKRTFTSEDLSSPDITGFPEIGEVVNNLSQGELSALINDGDFQWLIFYCEKRDGNGKKPFEECQEELEIIYDEQYFEREFKDSVESAQITIAENALKQISF